MKQEVVVAQQLIDDIKSSDNKIYYSFHPSTMRLCDPGIIMALNLSSLKNLTIGELIQHHQFICRELKDRSGQVTAAKEGLRSPPFSLTPLHRFTSSFSATTFRKRDVQKSEISASDILNTCEQTDNWDQELASDNLMMICRRMK